MTALGPGDGVLEHPGDEGVGGLVRCAAAVLLVRQDEGVTVGLRGRGPEERGDAGHGEREPGRLEGGDLPFAVEVERRLPAVEDTDGSRVVDAPHHQPFLDEAGQVLQDPQRLGVVQREALAVRGEHRAAGLRVEAGEETPGGDAVGAERLGHQPRLSGRLLRGAQGVGELLGAADRLEPAAGHESGPLADLGLVVEDEGVGVERDGVLLAAGLAPAPDVRREVLLVHAVFGQQAEVEGVEEPAGGEPREPGEVQGGELGGPSARAGHAELGVVRGAPLEGRGLQGDLRVPGPEVVQHSLHVDAVAAAEQMPVPQQGLSRPRGGGRCGTARQGAQGSGSGQGAGTAREGSAPAEKGWLHGGSSRLVSEVRGRVTGRHCVRNFDARPLLRTGP